MSSTHQSPVLNIATTTHIIDQSEQSRPDINTASSGKQNHYFQKQLHSSLLSALHHYHVNTQALRLRLPRTRQEDEA